MKPKVVKHLSDIEIDEVSLVDRAANQHATVAIAKRASEEESMPELFTEEGTPLDELSLVDGQIVYDAEGNAYQFNEDPGSDEEQEAFDFEPEDAAPEAEDTTKTLAAAGAGSTPGGAGMSKSFSEEVMEELSKAYSDEERDTVLSKALGRVEELLAEQAEAVEIAKAERELRLTNEYISKAADYNLPVDPRELGPVLYRMTESMSFEDCSVINKCLEAAGSALFEEVGYIGGGDNADVLHQVNAAASEYVGKSAGSQEEAWEQVFEANPQAYDEYLAQRRGY